MSRLALVCAGALLTLGGGCSFGSAGWEGELVVGRGDGIYLIDVESGEGRYFWKTKPFGGAWSPSGKNVAFNDRSNRGTIVHPLRSGAVARIDEPCWAPVWAPDDTMLACTSTKPWVISTLDRKTRVKRALTDPSDFSVAPAWSPDSQSIAYMTHGAVMVMGRDGRGKRRIADGGDARPGRGPVWSPDGNRIAYLSDGKVWIVNAAGGASRLLFEGVGATHGLSWSPDGRFLAMTHPEQGDTEIFVVDVADGKARNLTDNEGVDDRGTFLGTNWSPDSRLVAYLSDDEESRGVHVIPVDGGDPHRVSETLDTILYWSNREAGVDSRRER